MAIEDGFTEQAIRKLYYPIDADPKVISGESGAGGLAGFIALMTDPRFQNLKKTLNITNKSNILFLTLKEIRTPKISKNYWKTFIKLASL